MTSKTKLRAEMKAKREELASTLVDFKMAAAQHFVGAVRLSSQVTVAGYWPLQNEADPRGILSTVADEGSRLCLPVMQADGGLIFRAWHFGQSLVRAKMGVMEPTEQNKTVVPDLVLVPLLAFDSDGGRLGYGGGYYDRTLQKLRSTGTVCAVGIAYDGQFVQNLPLDSQDQPLDAVITEAGVRIFNKAAMLAFQDME